MSQKKIQISFFIVLTVILLVLSFFIFKPFVGVIFLASVLAVSFYPLYRWFVSKFGGNTKLASFVTVLSIIVCIVAPLAVLSANLVKESIEVYNSVALNNGAEKVASEVNALVNSFESLFFANPVSSNFNLDVYTRNILGWVINHFDSVLGAILDSFFKFALMLLSIYYLLINAEKIKRSIIKWSPLPDSYDEEVLSVLKLSVDSVLRGRLLVSIAQGFFMGVGFLIFGIGSPVLWGFATAIISLIPILGTALVTAPAVAYLFLSGHIGESLGMLLWGSLCVGLLDNFLYLVLFKGKNNIHPLIMLFSIVGGVEVMGTIGFLAGPIIVSAFFSLARIYPFIMISKEEVITEQPQ
jgi:predicted PurR-regulated permease PerM